MFLWQGTIQGGWARLVLFWLFMELDFVVDMSWFFIINSATTTFGFVYAWILSRYVLVNASSTLLRAALGTPHGIGRVGHRITVTLRCFTMGDLRTLQWRASGLLSITMGAGNSCLRLQGLRVLRQINVTLWCFTMGDLRTLKWRAPWLLSITMGVGNSCLRLQGLRALRQLIVVARLFCVRHRQNLKLVPGVVCLFSYGFLQATTDWIARVTVIVDHAVMVYSFRREQWDGVPVFPGLVHRYTRFSSASSRLHQERPSG